MSFVHIDGNRVTSIAEEKRDTMRITIQLCVSISYYDLKKYIFKYWNESYVAFKKESFLLIKMLYFNMIFLLLIRRLSRFKQNTLVSENEIIKIKRAFPFYKNQYFSRNAYKSKFLDLISTQIKISNQKFECLYAQNCKNIFINNVMQVILFKKLCQ